MNEAIDLDTIDLEAEYDALQAVRAGRSLHVFVEEAWRHVLKPEIPFQDNWHVGAICEHLEAVTRGEIKRLIVNVSPGTLKSTIASTCWPAWVWINSPSHKWLFTGIRESLTTELSADCRRVIESAWYQGFWGQVYGFAPDQNEKKQYENTKRGVRQAMGILAGGTGLHSDFIVCDDPHDRDDCYKPNALKASINAWELKFSQCVNSFVESRLVVIGQRVAHKDLSGHLLAQGDYEHLMIPTEYAPRRSKVTAIGWKDPRKKSGELLQPKRLGPAELKREKARVGYKAQHQQDPTPDEDSIFHRDWWQLYSQEPAELALDMDEIVQSWDMSFKDLKSSSKVSGQVWGRKGADKFLLDRQCEHLDFNASLQALVAMVRKWPKTGAKLIEDKANGTAILTVLKAKVSGLIGWPPPGIQMGSKLARAHACQPEQQAGNLWLPDPDVRGWVREYIEIMADFRGLPDDDDDDVDATSQVLGYFRQKEQHFFQGEIVVPVGVGKSYWKGAG